MMMAIKEVSFRNLGFNKALKYRKADACTSRRSKPTINQSKMKIGTDDFYPVE